MQRDHEASSQHPQTTHSTTSLESLLKLRTDSCGAEHQDQDQELHGNSEPAINPGVQDIAAGQDAAAENINEHKVGDQTCRNSMKMMRTSTWHHGTARGSGWRPNLQELDEDVDDEDGEDGEPERSRGRCRRGNGENAVEARASPSGCCRTAVLPVCTTRSSMAAEVTYRDGPRGWCPTTR